MARHAYGPRVEGDEIVVVVRQARERLGGEGFVRAEREVLGDRVLEQRPVVERRARLETRQ